MFIYALQVWRLPYEERSESKTSADNNSEGEKEKININEDNKTNKKEIYKAAYLSRNIQGGKPWVDCIITDPPYGNSLLLF